MVAGFLAMIGFAFIAFTVAFVLIGEDAVFLRGTYETSVRWTVVSAVLGFLTATVGGVVCGSVSPRSAATWVLVGLVVVVGVAHAVVSLAWGTPGSRSGDAHLLEAQMLSQSPTWFLLATPVIDVAGITLGSMLARHGEPFSDGSTRDLDGALARAPDPELGSEA